MGRRRLAHRSPLQTFCLITVVATDDEKIAECCRGFGADVIMTAESCRYGAERCSEALQGDEPLIEPEIIKGLSKLCRYHLVLLCTRPPEAAMFGQLPRLLIVPLIAIIGREQTDPTSPDERVPEPPRPTVYSFCKVLTASDTSTHGGFSVLRKHANECLPALDMTQATPAQDLQAFDLHGTEWRFKHIFMGQPRRHMLITGWSTFVTNKRLVAGDSFVFLRGEYSETRVGVRRQAHQPSSMPTSVISSQSMHLGVLATASHAVSTQTHFVVYYKQRTSQFIVSLNKYIEAVNNAFTVEMRFKMRFEGDDSPEKRFTGTIVAVGDVSPQWED